MIDDAGRGRAFQATLVAALAEWVGGLEREKIDTVALGGGCFLNACSLRSYGVALRRYDLNVLERGRCRPTMVAWPRAGLGGVESLES